MVKQITYEVEKIVDSKKEDGQIFYQVKWVGYKASDNTWEPVTNLEYTFEKIKQFENSQIKKTTKKTAPASPTTAKQSKPISKAAPKKSAKRASASKSKNSSRRSTRNR